MSEKPYHHGNLHTELIEEGLALIHEEGRSSFSLRKLAKRIGVSPAACYNHYKDSEDLLREMKAYVTRKFCDALQHAASTGESGCSMIEMGKEYVNFFAQNPHYFTFVYDNEDYQITLTEDSFEGDFAPFKLFKDVALTCMERDHIDPAEYHDNLLIMWASVHGLAAMANMQGFHYDGDWKELCERLMMTKVILTKM